MSTFLSLFDYNDELTLKNCFFSQHEDVQPIITIHRDSFKHQAVLVISKVIFSVGKAIYVCGYLLN